MKRLLVTMACAVLALVSALLTAVPLAAEEPEVVGQLCSNGPVGSTGYCTGVVQLRSDGSIQGDWSWTRVNLPYGKLVYDCVQITSLSFPRNDVAVMTGLFEVKGYPNNSTPQDALSTEMTFIVIANALDLTQSVLLAYTPGNVAVQVERGLFQVTRPVKITASDITSYPPEQIYHDYFKTLEGAADTPRQPGAIEVTDPNLKDALRRSPSVPPIYLIP